MAIALLDILGQPPQNALSSELTYNSLPVMEIIPSTPHFEEAATLFSLESAMTDYKSFLTSLGYSMNGDRVKIAFIADSFPTESFTNQYSESFLNKFTDVVSTGAAELAQITGQRSASAAGGQFLKSMAGSNNGLISALGSGAQSAVSGIQAGIKNLTAGMGKTGKNINKLFQSADKLLGGARADFPQIWKNSGYTPSYTITVRLYNPVPSNLDFKEKYIIGPLAAILLLALPQTDDGIFYNWPFFHQISVPGMFEIPSAFIGNITVVKGGDQQQITYSQELGVVDVRIEFGSLFDTIVVGKSKYKNKKRPTLSSYLDNLRGRRNIYVDFGSDVEVGPFQGDEQIQTSVDKRQNQGTVDTESQPENRVSTQDNNDARFLLNEQPTFA